MASRIDLDVPVIPDLTEYKLRTLYSGDLRGIVSQRFLSVLRMVARGAPESIRFCIRGTYAPDAPLQQRLRWSLHVVAEGAETSAATLKGLTSAGPVSAFYEFKELKAPSEMDAGGYCEVLRRESAVRPFVERKDNAKIPDFYYSVAPFVPNDGNDWIVLDRALAEGGYGAATVDILVAPTDVAPQRSIALRWLSQLRSINSASEQAYDPNALKQAGTLFPGKTSTYSSEPVARDPLADDFAREAQDLITALRKPHVRYALRVLAADEEQARAIAAVVAECAFRDDQYQLVSLSPSDALFADAVRAVGVQAFCDAVANPAVYGLPADTDLERALPPGQRALRGAVRVATPAELAGVFRLPMAGTLAPRCMKRSTDPKEVAYRAKEAAQPDTVLAGYDLETGVMPRKLSAQLDPKKGFGDLDPIFDARSAGSPLMRLPLKLFKKHVFIVGASGSGKTVASLNLLAQLWRAGIPWLVIEPAKTEYRVLAALTDHPDPEIRKMAESVQVYTPGNESISPMRINPFAYPEGGNRDEHIDQIFTAFKAAFPLGGPMEALLLEAIERAYEVRAGETPTMVDLMETAETVLRSKGYAGEVESNLKAAIQVRLGSLVRRSVGRIFSADRSIPDYETLLKTPTVIELEHVSPEIASLLTLMILSGIREHIRHAPLERGGRRSGSPLKHVIVIEEAHNIVGHVGGPGGEDQANPKYHAAAYVGRMLAEIRALGEGMILIDQLPSAVSAEVVKNTGTKYAGRLVAKDDRETIAATMLLSETQSEDLARLKVGQAFLYHEDLHAPRRFIAMNAAEYLTLERAEAGGKIDLADKVAGKEFVNVVGARPWYQIALAARRAEVLRAIARLVERARAEAEQLLAARTEIGTWLERSDAALDRLAALPEQAKPLLEPLVAHPYVVADEIAELERAFFGLVEQVERAAAAILAELDKRCVDQLEAANRA
jgi:hypothetical protein